MRRKEYRAVHILASIVFILTVNAVAWGQIFDPGDSGDSDAGVLYEDGNKKIKISIHFPAICKPVTVSSDVFFGSGFEFDYFISSIADLSAHFFNCTDEDLDFRERWISLSFGPKIHTLRKHGGSGAVDLYFRPGLSISWIQMWTGDYDFDNQNGIGLSFIVGLEFYITPGFGLGFDVGWDYLIDPYVGEEWHWGWYSEEESNFLIYSSFFLTITV